MARTTTLGLYGGPFGAVGVYDIGGADITAPVLSSPTGAASALPAVANGTVSTDEANGTLYWVVTQSATTPSVAQIQAGLDDLGAAADADGTKSVTETGLQAVQAVTLVASTTYYFHFQHRDAASNDSTAVSSASFTTAASAPATVNPRRGGRLHHGFRIVIPFLLLML